MLGEERHREGDRSCSLDVEVIERLGGITAVHERNVGNKERKKRDINNSVARTPRVVRGNLRTVLLTGRCRYYLKLRRYTDHRKCGT